MLAGAEFTPIDLISGLPLLIAPDDRALFILHGLEPAVDPKTGQVLADWNHNFHPAAQVLAGGDGAAAVRNARMQYVLRSTHNEYHAAYYGPPLPTKPSERFRTAVLCAAGYIPMQAIQFGTDGPSLVDLSPMQRERLRTSREVKVASLSVVRHFMRQYVLNQPMDHIKPRTINKFLKIDPTESVDAAKQHRYLTHLLLSLVIDRVEDVIEEPYAFGYDEALLAPDAPERPDLFVQYTLAPNRKNTQEIAKELTRKLLLQRDGPSATPLGGLALAH